MGNLVPMNDIIKDGEKFKVGIDVKVNVEKMFEVTADGKNMTRTEDIQFAKDDTAKMLKTEISMAIDKVLDFYNIGLIDLKEPQIDVSVEFYREEN